MKSERQTPTIKVGTSSFHTYTPTGETGLHGGQFTVTAICPDGVLVSIDSKSTKISFQDAERLFT